MVHGVPEHAEPPSTRPPRRPVEAVLFDFHGTLAQVEDAVDWVTRAAAACGTTLDRPRATALADQLVTAGRAGGPIPPRVPPHLAEVFVGRDLSAEHHRRTYTGLAATVDTGIEGLADALYERVLVPEGWAVYPDALPTLQALRAVGIAVGIVSNIGFDIRDLLAGWGLADLVDHCVLSYEVGRVKPDPAIFRYACNGLGVPPERTLMIGDTPADAAAVHAGCAALILPAQGPGEVNGLAAVLALTYCDAHHMQAWK
jgi:HAD superfamily hydrolase (TIGR01509 family)